MCVCEREKKERGCEKERERDGCGALLHSFMREMLRAEIVRL